MANITPRVDIAFKKIFGVEENKDLLISLINSIVSKEDQVSQVTLLNPYNPKNFRNDKLSILDIKALGVDGKRFNVEIQISNEADYDKRALYYWAKLYTEQLKESDDYSLLSKAIGIHILNFTSIPESEKYHNAFHIVEKDNGYQYFKDLELHTVELKKFADAIGNELSDIISKIKTSLDIWAAFLTKYNLLDKDNLPKNLEETGLKKALNVLEVMNFNQAEREDYEDHLKWLRIQTNTIKKYQQDGREEALKEGREEGLKEGIKKGVKEGIEIGEEKKAISMAKEMLLNNEPMEKIIQYTGLAKKTLENLKA
jgi:predicted transposase/invertase (TIGR01784 family)